MNSWFDIGVNLFDKRFDANEVVDEAYNAGVTHICAIASNIEESIKGIDFTQQYLGKSTVYSTVGVHPHYADSFNNEHLSQLRSLASSNNVIAIGECGLDFNRNFSSPKNQKKVFEQQLQLASELAMPILLHERDAFDTQVAMLSTYLPNIPTAVVHCFTAGPRELSSYLSMGCYIGVTGWACDPKRGESLREAIAHIPLNKLVLETDAPYLYPKTRKPKKSTNHPQYLPYIAETIAKIKNITVSELSSHCLENSYSLFQLTE